MVDEILEAIINVAQYQPPVHREGDEGQHLDGGQKVPKS